MSEPALQLVGVTKRYHKITERSLLRTLWPFNRPPVNEVTALHGIDLAVEHGEAVGIIGRNGAGKSTLLRLLAGVTQPSDGTVTVYGRVAPLLSVGVGFHPEMTGRENVFINGMLLGLTKDQVAQRFGTIVEFADIPGFIDTPVKFYSSGMFMRLGFAVAVHSDPDVLIIDEVLAVGDNAFQLRSLNRIRELSATGTTIIFVSHSMHAVHLLCPRAVFVDGGQIAYDGPTEEAIARYHGTLASQEGVPGTHVEFIGADLTKVDGGRLDFVDQHDELQLTLRTRFLRPLDGPGVWFHVIAGDASIAYSMQTPVGEKWRSFAAGEEVTISVRFTPRLAGGGSFHVNVDITEADGTVVGTAINTVAFYVPPRLGASGPGDLMARILIDGEERTQKWTRLGGSSLPSLGDES